MPQLYCSRGNGKYKIMTIIFDKGIIMTGLKQVDALSPILFNLAMQKVIKNIQMFPDGIKIGKE
jgi:hypothetical protein